MHTTREQDLLTDFAALNTQRLLQQIKGIEEEEEGMDDDENLPLNKKPKAQPKHTNHKKLAYSKPLTA